MGVITPQTISVKKERDPSSGDTADLELQKSDSTNNVILLPEVPSVAVFKEPSEKIVKRSSRFAKEKKKFAHSVCLMIMFVCGLGIVAVTALETTKHMRLFSRVYDNMPGFLSAKTAAMMDDKYHIHSDKTGNMYRDTLASEDHCIHRRQFLLDDEHDEVLHDTRSKWSVLIENNRSRCLLFFMANQVETCPRQYPWGVDEIMGAVGAKAALRLSREKKTNRVVSRLITGYPLSDISCAGPVIEKACKDHLSYEVLAVSVCYVNAGRFRRMAPLLGVRVESAPIDNQEILYDIVTSPMKKENAAVEVESLAIDTHDWVLSKVTTTQVNQVFGKTMALSGKQKAGKAVKKPDKPLHQQMNDGQAQSKPKKNVGEKPVEVKS